MANDAPTPLPSAEDFVELIRDRLEVEAILHFHMDWLYAPIPPAYGTPSRLV